MPKLVEGLEQNGKEWHAFRLAHIGSSDVPKILLCDPFEGPAQDFQLYLEKLGTKQNKESDAGSEAMKHGKDSEPIARMQYAAETGEVVLPCVVECEHEGFEFLACSLDGASHDLKLICEIKCPYDPGTFRKAKEGEIPPDYFAQMQHQLLVTGAERCDYYCWFAGIGVLIPVKPDHAYWVDKMLPAVKEFWRRVQTKQWPMPEGEVRFVTADEATRLDRIIAGGGKVNFTYSVATAAYLEWAEKMDGLKTMELEIENAVAAHKALGAREFWGNAKKIVGGGLAITRVHKKGYPVSYTVSESIQTTIRRTA